MKTVVRHKADVFRLVLLAGTACLLQACSGPVENRDALGTGYPVGMAEQSDEALVAMLMDDTLESNESQDRFSTAVDVAEDAYEETAEPEQNVARLETQDAAPDVSAEHTVETAQNEPIDTDTNFDLMDEEEGEAFASSAVNDDELDEQRGAAGLSPLVLNDLQTVSSGNSVTGTSFTGENNIGQGAFTFSGVGTVIQNSGNNTVIQNATIVNMTINSAPIE